MKYSINIADATKLDFIGKMLIQPVIQSKLIVNCEKTIDGQGVILDCEEERAEAIIEVLRMKYERPRMRCYKSKPNTKTWQKI